MKSTSQGELINLKDNDRNCWLLKDESCVMEGAGRLLDKQKDK